ncbi:MAG: hypothetical protein QOE96_836 [Blastocatellia bacterium]|jgi:hypothetical protein|nr:hypothetical protein [Blastocatellia bacterium]
MLKVEDFGTVDELLASADRRDRMIAAANAEVVCVTRKALASDFVAKVIDYLTHLGRNSLPNRHPTLTGCPNHHRVYQWDELSYVKGCYHQFSFFPWNEDVFELFKNLGPTYRLRNLLNGLAPERYLGREPDDDCIARISFQFYPRGKGAMNKHRDPVDVHQKIVPILIMTKRGVDYEEGGLFYEAADGARVWADEVAGPGDVVWAQAQLAHGVDPIDPGTTPDWLSFRGRWSAVVAVNKMVTNTRIGDALDLVDEKTT